jgi:hypothetical protein
LPGLIVWASDVIPRALQAANVGPSSFEK